jgi:oligopeptide/dipeptide ABC transporter ATP-binding protein
VVEERSRTELFAQPMHPYTAALLGARPSLSERRERLATIPGRPASALDGVAGCPFHPRCRFAIDRCASERPTLRLVDGAATACLRVPEIAAELHG